MFSRNPLHLSLTEPPSWEQVLFWQKTTAAIIYPPGDDKKQIPSLRAGNMELWLCKHIKKFRQRGRGGSHSGNPGCIGP